MHYTRPVVVVQGETPILGQERLLALSTGNSCRSQTAEGLTHRELGLEWAAHSAGTAPAPRANPLAVRVMAEVGSDISDGRPKHVDAMVGTQWDREVRVYDSAREVCPCVPHPGEQIHVGVPDPAEATGPKDVQLVVYRQVRDLIRERLVPMVQASHVGGVGGAGR
jgi:arsenate reductase